MLKKTSDMLLWYFINNNNKNNYNFIRFFSENLYYINLRFCRNSKI